MAITPIPSDETLINLNRSIESALNKYLPEGVAIRFDLPAKDENSDIPTVCVFLFDIQEDLQLRAGEGRQYVQATGKLLPGYVNIRCRYLITYFEPPQSKSSDSPASRADSQALRMINNVLNALVNQRTFLDLPGSYTQVIPPTEQLNSLGNFWQAVGNTPRLCLSYMVTVPLRLTDPQTYYPSIKDAEVLAKQIPGTEAE
jgi:hypothetical protein